MTILPTKLTMLAAMLVLAGCSTTKPPEQVSMDVPAQYKEAAALEGAWKMATPADNVDRGEWWNVFNDSALDALIVQATEASPTLAAAVARVQEARAIAGIVDSDRAFRLVGGAGPTRIVARPLLSRSPHSSAPRPNNDRFRRYRHRVL